MVQSGGRLVVSGLNSAVVSSGEIRSLQALQDFTLTVPPAGARGSRAGHLRLGDIAQVEVRPVDPPESAAIYRGEDAVVLGVSMRKGQNVKAVGGCARVWTN